VGEKKNAAVQTHSCRKFQTLINHTHTHSHSL